MEPWLVALFSIIFFLCHLGIWIILSELQFYSCKLKLVFTLFSYFLQRLLRSTINFIFKILYSLAVFLLTEDVHFLFMHLEICEFNWSHRGFIEYLKVRLVQSWPVLSWNFHSKILILDFTVFAKLSETFDLLTLIFKLHRSGGAFFLCFLYIDQYLRLVFRVL